MKDRVGVLTFVLGMVVGAALCALVMLRLRGPGADTIPPPAPPLASADVKTRQITQTHWQDNGYVEMVPPIRLPTTMDAEGDIKVWIKIPAGGVITARTTDTGKKIDFPAGTIADRVESFGDIVADVRGTELLDAGERFHVYVPKTPTAQSPLTGWEWPRDDVASQTVATEQLLGFLRSAPLLNRPQDPIRARNRRLWDYRRNNDCTRCHFADKPETHDADDVVHRGTDDDGWYVPLTVLSDEGVLERHRPSDPNVDDRFINVRCDTSAVKVEEQNGRKRYRCEDGSAVLGRYDIRAALKEGDKRAQAVCNARRELHAHMDANARALFSDAFSVCGI